MFAAIVLSEARTYRPKHARVCYVRVCARCAVYPPPSVGGFVNHIHEHGCECCSMTEIDIIVNYSLLCRLFEIPY